MNLDVTFFAKLKGDVVDSRDFDEKSFQTFALHSDFAYSSSVKASFVLFKTKKKSF